MGKNVGGSRAIGRRLQRAPATAALAEPEDAGPYRQIGEDETYDWTLANYDHSGWDYDQRIALANYTGNAYTKINDGLRNGTLESDKVYSKLSAAMDAFFETSAARVPENITVWRTAGIEFGMQIAQAGVGSTFSDKAFVSTAMNERWADYRLKVNVPKGTKGVSVKNISDYPDENEFLLPRNSRFRVTGIETVQGTITINVTVLK